MAATLRQWEVAVGTGGFRVAVGSALLASRGFAARVLGADRDDRLVPAVIAGLGVRDTALGLAAFASTRPGADVSRQPKLQAVNDVLDAVVLAGLAQAGRIGRWQGYTLAAISVAWAGVDLTLARAAGRPPGVSATG